MNRGCWEAARPQPPPRRQAEKPPTCMRRGILADTSQLCSSNRGDLRACGIGGENNDAPSEKPPTSDATPHHSPPWRRGVSHRTPPRAVPPLSFYRLSLGPRERQEHVATIDCLVRVHPTSTAKDPEVCRTNRDGPHMIYISRWMIARTPVSLHVRRGVGVVGAH